VANDEDGYFRASAGILIVNEAGSLLAMRRKATAEPAWQLPQGGIRFDESPVDAAWREAEEEAGLTRSDLTLLAESRQWLVYELPHAFRNRKVGWGQAQRWFLFRLGADSRVKVDAVEFDAFDWVTPAELLARTVEFRVPVYERVLAEFGPRIQPSGAVGRPA
jgi:putative (di)nucleoside polyphosphate hydrolase